MKFELVDFYPITAKPGEKIPKGLLGTVHLYAIDCDLDIRGILVRRGGKKIFFSFPHLKSWDTETNSFVRYPVVRWNNQEVHESMIEYLQTVVQPIIEKKLKGTKKEKVA